MSSLIAHMQALLYSQELFTDYKIVFIIVLHYTILRTLVIL